MPNPTPMPPSGESFTVENAVPIRNEVQFAPPTHGTPASRSALISASFFAFSTASFLAFSSAAFLRAWSRAMRLVSLVSPAAGAAAFVESAGAAAAGATGAASAQAITDRTAIRDNHDDFTD